MVQKNTVKKKSRGPLIIGIVLFIIIGLPLITIGISFIGRIAPDSIIPDSFDLYADVPNTMRLAGRVLNHESLTDIIALTELSPLVVPLNQFRNSGLAENRWIRLLTKGRLNAAFLSTEPAAGTRNPGRASPPVRMLAAWDAGVLSPLLRIFPALMGRTTIPGLYYVQAGKNSRFEYRMDDGAVYFFGPYKNLLVISDDSALFESVLAGASRDGDRVGSSAKSFYSREHDIAFLISPPALKKMLGDGGSSPGETDPQVLSALRLLQFSGPVEASLSILPNQLKINLVSPLGTSSQALQKIIERNSQAASLVTMISSGTQYMTLLSAGSLQELLDGVSAFTGPGVPDWENVIRRANSSARMTFNMGLEELLYSWMGTQFAVYGLEGRPNPIVAIEIRDEKKRKEVFDKAFRSIFVNENVQLNLDGNRIPQIQIPSFLESLLELLDVNIPLPYYTVQNNCLLMCESAETLLAAVNAVRRNDVLPRTNLWRTLSQDNSGPSSFSLFYSLDRSLPFFLKGGSEATAVLRLYRQGLARLSLENSVLRVSLSVIPGAGRGIVPVSGFPLELAGTTQQRAGNRLFSVSDKEPRLILTRGSDVLAVNPVDQTIREWKFPGAPGANLYAIPNNGGENVRSSATNSAAVWVVDSHGLVSLLNKDLENMRGFPLSTGIQLSAPPESWGGKLYLCDEDGSVHTVDSGAQVRRWGTNFSAALRSPPSFLDNKNKTYAAVYPKSFIFMEIHLLNGEGNPLPNWPIPVSGIAFGSPLLFNARPPHGTDTFLAAFITQAGELTVFVESGKTLLNFPLKLDGVFFLQPVFDGETLWVIESEGTLYRIGLDGEVLSHKIPRLSVRENGYITTGNGAVFITGEGNVLYGYSRNFNSLDGFPLPVWGRPIIGDLNNDKKIEAAGVGMDNQLYMWQFR